MCLSRVTQTLDGTITMIEGGWKYFEGAKRDEFPHCRWNDSKTVPVDQWITASGSNIGTYKAGFHILTDETQARKTVGIKLRRVYFRRVTAIGMDQQMDTIVAQEMYVPSNEDDWPPREARKKGA